MTTDAFLRLPAVVVAALVAASAWAAPIHDAARAGDINTARQLVAEGADVQAIDDETALTPLIEAALAGHRDMVVFLIENGAAPGGRDGKGFTAVHAAAHMGHVEIVELLIERGIEINDQQNVSRVTPLHLAAERDHREVAKMLLRHGAALDLKTESGHTPVVMAVLNAHADMVKMLRDHGADCSFRSKRFSDYCLNAGN